MIMNEAAHPPAISDYLGALRRRHIYLITILPAAIFICVVAAFAIHPLFQATATIMLEPSSVPKDIIETTVISYSDQQIEIVQGRVMTVDSLQHIVKEIDPYPDRKTWSAADKAQRILDDTTLERVDPVTLKPQAESNTFSLHYNNPNPELSTVIDNRLAQLFLTYNQRRRAEAAGEATGFLKKQSEDVARQMREVDAQLVLLRNKFGEARPEFLLRNQSVIEDTQRQLDSLQQQILTVQEKESVLSLQLSQMSPNLIAGSSAGKMLQTANNPQYLMTATELQGARNELANLQALANSMRGKLERNRTLVGLTPAAEREFAEVLRRKEVLQNEFQHTQDRLQSANLAETFETHQGGERFTLIRAPSVPKLPVYPNRVGLILLGLVFGAALAGIAVAVAESTDKNVRTARDVVLPDGVPVLASIPYIENKKDRRHRAIMFSTFVGAYSAAFLIVIAVIVSARHH
jgi:uncharacterized protein involved in exopolysaccharide biosynthesis